MQDLNGKVAVVTGAASGIGLALTRRFGAEGMKVVMGDVEASALAAAAESLRAEGVEVATVMVDVSDPSSVEQLARKTLESFGAVHLLCNNAGVGGGGPTWEIPLSTWDWIVGVNMLGVVHGIRSFVPRMIEQDEGHVVNTASIAGLISGPGMSPYNATKHAVVAISEALHHELALIDSPVKVSVLCPGFVRTRIHEADRNWPERYGSMPTASTQLGGRDARQWVRQAIESGMDPSVIAEAVHQAVLDEKFWILTHPELNDVVLDRYRGAVEGRNPATIRPT